VTVSPPTIAWVLLLRGVNVGGRHTLPMRELAELLEALGLEEVRTYIQSGNAVFRAAGEAAAALGDRIAAAIEERKGFRPEVLVLSAERLEAAARANPFPEGEAEPKTLHLFFLAATPTAPDLAGLEALRSPTERFHLATEVLYLHAPDGIGRSKLATRVERLLGVPATARNWRTVQMLREMSGEG
jgi:uncharacterized protein (DUF1697 family)